MPFTLPKRIVFQIISITATFTREMMNGKMALDDWFLVRNGFHIMDITDIKVREVSLLKERKTIRLRQA